ncbi:hypothetical protein QTP88_002233 [Uroleucon formosanum]
MIEKAKSSHATPSQIYSEIVANCTTNVLAELPREDYLKRTIQGNRGHNDPAKPKTINDITIEAEAQTWFVDGNFGFAPIFFTQLYVVSAGSKSQEAWVRLPI